MSSISLTRALSELKTIRGRLDTQLATAVFTGVAVGVGDKKRMSQSPTTVADFEKSIVSAYDSATALIGRYVMLKQALVKANAETMVTISGESMSIAAAIERKASITMQERLLASLKKSWTASVQECNACEAQLQKGLDTLVAQVLGSDKTKVTEEQIKAVTEPKRLEYAPSLVNPLDILNKIDDLATKIASFLAEVDFCLSEINARTMIDVAD